MDRRREDYSATCPGVQFYGTLGFGAVEHSTQTLPDGRPFPVVQLM